MIALFIASLVSFASAGVIHDGGCPDIKPVDNFNVTAYSGLWYEISKFENVDEGDGKCATAEYTPDGDIVRVKNTNVVNGVQRYIEGTAKLADDANGTAKLVVSFTFGPVTANRPLNGIATDYTNYGIAYNCVYDEAKKTHQDNIWILSRTKTLEGAAKEAVDTFLKNNAKDIDTSKLVQTDFSEEACQFTSSAVISERPQ